MGIELLNHTVISASTEQISCDLGGEAVILNFKDNSYYGLNNIGQTIWNLVQKPVEVSKIKEIVISEYDIEPELCEKDLTVILEEMLTKGLIEIKNG